MKKYSEINTTELYAALALRGLQVPEQVQLSIYDWFCFREVCDDDKFETFFIRRMLRDYSRFLELLRIEAGQAQFDWLVENYKERMLNHEAEGSVNRQGTRSDELETNRTINANGTRTPNITITTQGETEGHSEGETTDTGTVRNVTNKEGQNSSTTNAGTSGSATSVQKNLPASSATADDLGVTVLDTPGSGSYNVVKPTINFATAEQQTLNQGYGSTEAQSDTVEEDTSNETRNLGGTSENSDTGSYSESRVTSGNETNVTRTTDTQEKTGSQTTTGTETNTTQYVDKEIYTGRDTEIPRLLNAAAQYIKDTSAFAWLVDDLDVCFYGLIEV